MSAKEKFMSAGLKTLAFMKKNVVLCVAVVCALVTSFIIPPDGEYAGYFDLKTLTCLFCVLAVVCALRNIRFFTILAHGVVKSCKNTRLCVLVLVYITFVGSMLIANDMALLTFLPLGYFALESTGKQKYMAFMFIMQNISANLGGMLTPFGNPQNLYLYTKFNIPTGEFMGIMLFPFLLSVALITFICLIFVKNEPMKIEELNFRLNKRKAAVYLVLFALSIIIVFRVIPYYIGLAVILVVLLFADRKALKAVDYPLLLTFCAFFVFAGNMARIEVVREAITSILDKNTLIVSALSCQLISNVPTAVLLSNFTGNYAQLLLGVNIGGVGTLISSLASLITFRQYSSAYPGQSGKYILKFSAFNFFFLIVLLAAESLFLVIA